MIGDVTDPRSELLADPVLEYGDRVAADAGLILRSTVGSGVHGIAMATSFLSREAQRFFGFMRSQRDRLVTGRDTPNRPELVAKHGYDCYLDDTEFLARRGWLTYDRVEDEDVAAHAGSSGGPTRSRRSRGTCAWPGRRAPRTGSGSRTPTSPWWARTWPKVASGSVTARIAILRSCGSNRRTAGGCTRR
jgi:hypothetical protein